MQHAYGIGCARDGCGGPLETFTQLQQQQYTASTTLDRPIRCAMCAENLRSTRSGISVRYLDVTATRGVGL